MGYDKSVREANNIALGQLNKHIISDTSAHTFSTNVVVLQALTDVVVSSLTDSTINSGSMSGLTIMAGQLYFGSISAVTLTSGTLIAYEG